MRWWRVVGFNLRVRDGRDPAQSKFTKPNRVSIRARVTGATRRSSIAEAITVFQSTRP